MKIATLKRMWKDFNEKYFQGYLNEIPIRLTRSKRLYGYFEPTTNSRQAVIRISGHLNRSEEEFRDTLLHEMVHQAMHQFRLKDDGDHGTVFHQIASKIGVKQDYVGSDYRRDIGNSGSDLGLSTEESGTGDSRTRPAAPDK